MSDIQSDLPFTGERYIPTNDWAELDIEHLQRYQFVLPLIAQKVVLDAACGEGYGSSLMAQTAAHVTGLDISQESIAHANAQYANDTCSFVCSSIETLPVPDHSVDVVISFETIEHVPETVQYAFLTEIKRVLKEDGLLVMSTPNKKEYSEKFNEKNEFHFKEFYKEEFISFLKPYFSSVVLYSQYHETVTLLHESESNDTHCVLHGPDSRIFDEKYMMALASSTPVRPQASAFLPAFALNNARISRILELQDAVAQDEIRLADEVTVRDNEINMLNHTIRELNRTVRELNYVNRGLNDNLAYLKQLSFYKLHVFPREHLFPINTRRGFIVRASLKMIKSPRLLLSNMRPHKIATFLRLLKNGEYSRIKNIMKMQDDIEQYSDTKLVLEKVTTGPYEAFKLPIPRNPKVSIIVPVYNEFSYTYACLIALNDHTTIPYEVIIADDCSTDETVHIEDIIENVIHVRTSNNMGFLHNCNQAAQMAKGEYICFLNNDTQVQPDWLEPLIDLMVKNQKVGMTGAKLVYPNGQLQEAGGILWADGHAHNYGRFQNPQYPEYNYVKEADYISGAAIVVRKTVWELVGGFDIRYAPAYCEDSDLAFEIRKHGYLVLYQPKSVVVHFEGISNGTDVSEGTKQYQVENQKKFFEKWRDVLAVENCALESDVFMARHRGKHKETILFIDHYVPMFDKDAGSRNTFSYLSLFARLGYHVVFLGENTHPYQPYTEVLQQLGVEVLYGIWYQKNWENWLEKNGENLSYVYLNRPDVSEKYIEAIRRYTSARVIFHGHDLHFARLEAQYQLERTAALHEQSQRWKQREQNLFEQVDVILTVSQKEKPIIESLVPGKPVIVLPIFYFDTFSPISSFAQRKNLLFVGGFGHPPNTDAVLWFAKEIMPLLPTVKLIIAGSNPPNQVLALNSPQIEVLGFVSDETLNGLYASCRIAVIPLRFGAGVKGKTIEAMHHLIPIVSTSFGLEGLQDVESVVPICEDASAFAEEVNRLLVSDQACQSAVQRYEQWLRIWFSTQRAVDAVHEMTGDHSTNLQY